MPTKKEEWLKVFKAAAKKRKELKKLNPNLTFGDASKQAWKDPAILKLKEEYNKKFGSAESEEYDGGAVKKTITKTKKATPSPKLIKPTAIKKKLAAKITKK